MRPCWLPEQTSTSLGPRARGRTAPIQRARLAVARVAAVGRVVEDGLRSSRRASAASAALDCGAE